jgi:hypothetical protein
MGTYDNLEAAAGKGERKKQYSMLPTLDHRANRLEPDFRHHRMSCDSAASAATLSQSGHRQPQPGQHITLGLNLSALQQPFRGQQPLIQLINASQTPGDREDHIAFQQGDLLLPHKAARSRCGTAASPADAEGFSAPGGAESSNRKVDLGRATAWRDPEPKPADIIH